MARWHTWLNSSGCPQEYYSATTTTTTAPLSALKPTKSPTLRSKHRTNHQPPINLSNHSTKYAQFVRQSQRYPFSPLIRFDDSDCPR